jgi:hypothetical protein
MIYLTFLGYVKLINSLHFNDKDKNFTLFLKGKVTITKTQISKIFLWNQ